MVASNGKAPIIPDFYFCIISTGVMMTIPRFNEQQSPSAYPVAVILFIIMVSFLQPSFSSYDMCLSPVCASTDSNFYESCLWKSNFLLKKVPVTIR